MIYTAFVLGIAGSLHCVGMCGPIALALPVPAEIPRALGLLLYNAGRILTYGLLGLLVGLVGQLLALAGYQQLLSIVCGVLIVLWAILPLLPIRTTTLPNGLSFFHGFIKKQLSYFLKRRTRSTLLILGILNGFLPCGLVYVALAASLSTANSIMGGWFMVLFGLGTAPLMFAVGYVKNWLNGSWRTRLNRAIPVFAVLTGTLLIVRGLHLGIPYLSPQLSPSKPSCCHVQSH